MKIIRNPKIFQRLMDRLRRRGKTIGFVPTMGALHEGHLSLVRRARKENRVAIVSIFVNPLQFGPKEDFRRYPRNLSRDRALLRREKVDYLFAPPAGSLYSAGYQTLVEVAGLSRVLCGKFRPGHFWGVATVVAKLFNLAKPHRVYFGAKDYQQAVIIQRMARDLDFDVEVKVLPTVRDRDGLALSSRNAYLLPSERQRALAIPHSLAWAKIEVQGGNRNLRLLRTGVLRRLRSELDRVDYVEFMEPDTLQPIKKIPSPQPSPPRRGRGKGEGVVLLAVAGWAGKTRLIDNAIITP